jgi:hypothetical protein
MGFLNLFEVLKNDIPQVEERFDRINAGGCGVFALSLSDELNKKDIAHKIVWIGDALRNETEELHKKIHHIFESNENLTLDTFNNKGLYLSHVMVVIDGKYIDATGLYDGFSQTSWLHRKVITEITNEQLRILADNEDGWNCSFDRELIPNVKEMVVDIMTKIN